LRTSSTNTAAARHARCAGASASYRAATPSTSAPPAHRRVRGDRGRPRPARRAELAARRCPGAGAQNWLRAGARAKVPIELAAGTLPLSHEAPDAHPRRRGAGYLRQILVANHALGARDETLVRTERFLAELLAGIDHDPDRRLIAAFAWRVLRRGRGAVPTSIRARAPTRAGVTDRSAPRPGAWPGPPSATCACAEPLRPTSTPG